MLQNSDNYTDRMERVIYNRRYRLWARIVQDFQYYAAMDDRWKKDKDPVGTGVITGMSGVYGMRKRPKYRATGHSLFKWMGTPVVTGVRWEYIPHSFALSGEHREKYHQAP